MSLGGKADESARAKRGALRWSLYPVLLLFLIGVCLLAPASALAQTESDEFWSLWNDYLHRHMNDHEAWAEWVKQHAHPVALGGAGSESDDDFADLAPLASVLADRHIVMLGESSHGVREYNLAKVRLVRFLHQELGFDVLVFESSWADTYAVTLEAGALSAREMLERSLHPMWHTEEVLALFEYVKETQGTENPLQLAGIDMQPFDAFSNFVTAWLSAVDPMRGGAWRGLEGRYKQAVYALDYPWEELPTRVALWTLGYQELARFVLQNREELTKARPDVPGLAEIVLRAIAERIRVLDEFVGAKALVLSPANLFLPLHSLQNYPYVRDRIMADNLAWLAEEVYPGKKIIVWAHNYHIRKQNSSVQDDPLFMGLPTPTLGELLPDTLRARAYSLGLYMYSGSHADNNRVVQQIAAEHAPDSLEAIFAHAGYDVAFIDFKHQVPEVGNTWMFTERKALYAGPYEETLIPRTQYDGVLWFRRVQPPRYLERP